MVGKDRLLSEGSNGREGEAFLGEPDVGEPELKFDLKRWVAGFMPATRTVAVYRDLGLVGDRDALGIALDDARASRDEDLVEELKTQIGALTERIKESRVEIRLQELSQSTRQKLEDEDGYTVVAATIIDPPGFTADILRAWEEVNPSGANEVAKAANALNDHGVNVRLSTPF